MIKTKIQVIGSKAVVNSFKAKRENFDFIISNAVKKSAGIVESSAKQNCPVGTGNLRESIHYELKRKGFEARIGPDEIITPYAPYVEKGHIQQPGRYVHAIGKRLVKSFVEGKWFMKKSYLTTRRRVITIIEKAFRDAIIK